MIFYRASYNCLLNTSQFASKRRGFWQKICWQVELIADCRFRLRNSNLNIFSTGLRVRIAFYSDIIWTCHVMLGSSGLHLSSPFLKGTFLLCCQGSMNVRMRILICEPPWDSGAVAADFYSLQLLQATGNSINTEWNLWRFRFRLWRCDSCDWKKLTEKGFHVVGAVTGGWDNHLRTVVLKS